MARRYRRFARRLAAEPTERPARLAPFVIVAIPIDEAPQADIDRRARREAKIAASGGDVGIGRRHIALLHRYVLALGGLAHGGFERRDEIAEILGPVVAEIVDPV